MNPVPPPNDAHSRGSTGSRLNVRVPGWVAACVIVLVAAATTWLILRRTSTPVRPLERTALDFDVRWTCPNGHELHDKGAPGARVCPTCGGEMYATFQCTCTNPDCGHTAAMQLRYDQKGITEAMRWLAAGAWEPYVFPPRCNRCGEAMRPG